jgi:hypothetical protein
VTTLAEALVPVVDDKRCVERHDSLPYSSDHLWPAGLRGEPSGQCLKCGEHVWTYNDRITALFESERGKAMLAKFVAKPAEPKP